MKIKQPKTDNRPVAEALYASPSGRLCKLVRISKDAQGQSVAEMAYEDDTGFVTRDGFYLGRRNWHLLSRVR
ncbi:MAG: hypothetical protein MUF16_02280 [Burkholderiaceae bacterium]|jgi:hypothetical protein|nr:hypothetical protein [Burkholderiaceae bacterium]